MDWRARIKDILLAGGSLSLAACSDNTINNQFSDLNCVPPDANPSCEIMCTMVGGRFDETTGVCTHVDAGRDAGRDAIPSDAGEDTLAKPASDGAVSDADGLDAGDATLPDAGFDAAPD